MLFFKKIVFHFNLFGESMCLCVGEKFLRFRQLRLVGRKDLNANWRRRERERERE